LKKAFTLIELVLVIVVVGVLSTMVSPNFQRNGLQEAANQLVSHIRYTQHLAMMDNKFDSNKGTWFKERWQIIFARSVNGETAWSYTIFSDSSNRDKNPNHTREIARDPLNAGSLNLSGHLTEGQYLSGGYAGILPLNDKRVNKNMILGQKNGVKWISFSRSCSHQKPPAKNQSRRVMFDNIGRPYWNYKKDAISIASNPYTNMNLVRNQCVITLCDEVKCIGGEKVKIAIEPETGYTHIL